MKIIKTPFLIVLLFSCITINSMEQPPTLTDIKQPQTIDDIPEYCVNLIKKLDAQPWNNLSEKSCKTLPFNNQFGSNDARIGEILCENEKIKYPSNFWHIRIESDKQVNKGIIHIHSPHEITSPSFTELQTRYYSFIKKLQHGWHFEKASDYPDICHIKPETTHHLLIKKEEPLKTEHILIILLAEKFNIWHSVECDAWLKSSFDKGPTYLWVEKAAWQQFQTVFKLEVVENK